jgi:hypothetical protein
MCLPHCCIATRAARTTEKNRFFIVVRVRFRGNVFTKPLPSNELFRRLGVMSHCIEVSIEQFNANKKLN